MTSNHQTNETERVQQNERRDTMGTNVYSAMDNQSLHKSLNGEFILYQILLQRMLDQTKQLSSQKSTIYQYFKPSNPSFTKKNKIECVKYLFQLYKKNFLFQQNLVSFFLVAFQKEIFRFF
jgi:hypothetical protein